LTNHLIFTFVSSGQDPITGGPAPFLRAMTVEVDGKIREGSDIVLIAHDMKGEHVKVTGPAIMLNIVPSTRPPKEEYFVTSRGGEYFFVPSVPVLKKWAEDA
jgi:hypothetical protein